MIDSVDIQKYILIDRLWIPKTSLLQANDIHGVDGTGSEQY